jgi:hypothetical protein
MEGRIVGVTVSLFLREKLIRSNDLNSNYKARPHHQRLFAEEKNKIGKIGDHESESRPRNWTPWVF